MMITASEFRPQDRLRAARRRGGFPSLRKAAADHGWSEGTYAAHECGYRSPIQRWIDRYAVAFGVSAAWLTTGEPTGPADLEAAGFLPRPGEHSASIPRRGAARAAAALRRARTLCGIATPTAAARTYGWPVETYRSHESGRTPIPRRTAEVYAYAYDLPAEILDVARARVTMPRRARARRTGRPPWEVARFVDALSRPDRSATTAVAWILSLPTPMDVLDRLGPSSRPPASGPRQFRPMQSGWVEAEYGVPAEETAVLETRECREEAEPTSSLLVHLRPIARSDASKLRLLVTPESWALSARGNDAETCRRLREANRTDDASDPVRLPVLCVTMPAACLARWPAARGAKLDRNQPRPGP